MVSHRGALFGGNLRGKTRHELQAVISRTLRAYEVESGNSEQVIAEVKTKVLDICKRFPVYG